MKLIVLAKLKWARAQFKVEYSRRSKINKVLSDEVLDLGGASFVAKLRESRHY